MIEKVGLDKLTNENVGGGGESGGCIQLQIVSAAAPFASSFEASKKRLHRRPAQLARLADLPEGAAVAAPARHGAGRARRRLPAEHLRHLTNAPAALA